MNYRTRLHSLHLLPVSYWHEYLDLTLFFKITHGFVETSALPVIRATRRTTRSSTNNSVKYVIRKCKTTTYQQSYFVLVRTCRLWNGLADELHFNTNSLFKSILLKYYHQSLELSYDPDNPRTLKTICLKCNSVRIVLHVQCRAVIRKFIISMTKLLDADWLRGVQLFH